MKDEKKKVLIGSIIGILTLIILTVGATYAYFTFNSDNQFGSQSINASTEAIGTGVTLTKVGEGLTLDLKTIDMLEDKIGTSYYASGSSEPATIGKISVGGDGTYNCTYTMTISKTSTSEEKDLFTKFQNMSTKSEGQIYLNVNEKVYDFNTENLFPITYSGEVEGITKDSETNITANLTIVNTNVDQTELNDGDISLTFEVTEFNCGVDTYNGPSNGAELIANPTTGLETTTAYGGMYRYTGISVNNYVDIGGISYRIIGITSEANSTLGLTSGQLKVIKAESIGTYNWHTDYTTDTTWESSAMYTYLQGSSVLGSTSVVPSGWSSKISSVKWYIGDVNLGTNSTAADNGSNVLSYESKTTSSSSKVGLMYLSDYYYAYNSGGTTNCDTTACSSWLTTSSTQWTMTRYGGSSLYYPWAVYSSGDVSIQGLTVTYSVRPVFYLTSDVEISSGTGTSGDPFILKYE